MTPRDKFLMVDELASLVKNNDDSKCLILSVEDLLVEYLEDDTSLGGVIELVPMSSFNRMLVHRLADIFGPDTLLSRMLWKTRKWEIKQSPTIYNVLMRKGVSPSQKVDGCALDQADEGEKLALTSSDTTSSDTTSSDTTSSDTTSSDTRDQVYELIDIIKNNHSGKSLVLSVEELLVDDLEKDKSSDGLLELLPMDNFQRMLVHRLADIFGFSSYSVGEGKDRHVVLERCSETSIPDLLVSRLLWKTRKMETLQPPTTCDVLLRKEVLPEKDPVLGDRTIPSALGRADKAKIDYTNDEIDTNPSKRMKVALTMAGTTMPEVNKSGEEIPTTDGRSPEAQRKNNSNPLAELKNDTPDNFLKL